MKNHYGSVLKLLFFMYKTKTTIKEKAIGKNVSTGHCRASGLKAYNVLIKNMLTLKFGA